MANYVEMWKELGMDLENHDNLCAVLPGLLVGYISDITQESDGLSKSGHLTPVVSFDKLETVLIITTLKDSSEIEEIKKYD